MPRLRTLTGGRSAAGTEAGAALAQARDVTDRPGRLQRLVRVRLCTSVYNSGPVEVGGGRRLRPCPLVISLGSSWSWPSGWAGLVVLPSPFFASVSAAFMAAELA